MSSTTVRLRTEPLALVRAVPAWAWLAGLVAVSTLVRYALSRRTIAPWIFVDELIYSELAKSFAERGEWLVRDEQDGLGFGVVYSTLISPAWMLFDSIPAAYGAAKAINALLMSLTAVPVYLLARRVLSVPGALTAALLTLALPALFYASTLMTENAFFPLFATAALALVLVLERPSPARTLLFLGLVGLCYLTRAQAALLLPALLTAPLVLAALQRRPRALLEFRWVYGIPAAAFTALLALQAARGRSLDSLLGAYSDAGDAGYDLHQVSRWLLWHVAELGLAVGVVPVAALLLLLLVPGRLEGRDLPFLAATLALTLWVVAVVAAFASRHSGRIEERNMFYVMPLLLIALLLWIERGAPRPWRLALPAAAAAVFLVVWIPYENLIGVSAVSDTFGLLTWWEVSLWGVPLEDVWIVATAAAAVAAALWLLLPRPWLVALPALLLVFFVLAGEPVEERMRSAAVGELFQGITRERDWIDRELGTDAEVAALWSGRIDHRAVFENEFFSRSVGPVYTLAGPVPGGLAQTPLTADAETGRLLDPAGQPVRAEHAFTDDTVPLAGTTVARDERKGTRVLRVGGDLRLAYRVEGAYDDGWAGPELTYTRYECGGGTLLVAMESDPKLFSAAQTATATVGGRRVDTARIPQDGIGRLRVPLTAEEGRCVVRFRVSPSAVPGGGDTRRLGTHFRSFEYRP